MYVYVATYLPSVSLSLHLLASSLYNHHKSNEVPKVHTESTMIEMCTILLYS